MVPLSERTLAICRTYWRTTPQGKVAPSCCEGCPLMQPCSAPLTGPLSRESIDRHTLACNRAAASV